MPFFTNRGITPLPVGGGAPTTVFSCAFAGNTPTGGWEGYTIVGLLPASQMGAATGTQMRITLQFYSLPAGTTVRLYAGQKAAAGDAYDFNGNQVNVLFSGNTQITGNGSTLIWVSDWVTLGEAYDETKDYLFVMDNGGTAGLNFLADPAITGGQIYWASGVDAPTTNKSGYTTGAANATYSIALIEVR